MKKLICEPSQRWMSRIFSIIIYSSDSEREKLFYIPYRFLEIVYEGKELKDC